jgi:hypothetical protein
MNIDQWILRFSEAYIENDNSFLPSTKEMLLKKLPVGQEENKQNFIDRAIYETGMAPDPFNIIDQSQRNFIEEAKEIITKYFFNKFIYGEKFGPIKRIKEKYRDTIENNYNLSSGPFVSLAQTYWTFKIEIRDLLPEYKDLILTRILLEVEGDIASLFFPTPGPVVIWVRQRREDQRQLLEQHAPEIDIDAFLDNNPILGTSRGSVSKRVFSERILIRCQNPSCKHFLRVPNTVKALKIKCPKCKTSFRFPAEDFEWLNRLRPDVHPEPFRVTELENLRQLFDIPHNLFAIKILCSPWITRRIQESVYIQCREKMPKASEKEILKSVFKTRISPNLPFGYDMTEEEMNEAMKSITSLKDLTEYFIKRDEAEEPLFPDPFGFDIKINKILS